LQIEKSGIENVLNKQTLPLEILSRPTAFDVMNELLL
jgi:hypothetical protein